MGALRRQLAATNPNAMADKPNMHIPEGALEQYAMGELDEAETERVEEHLLICERCQAEVELVDSIRHALKATEPRRLG